MTHNHAQSVRVALVTLFASLSAGLQAQHWAPKGPVPRYSTSAVFDPATKRMIVFGGLPDTPSTNLNDIFWLSGASAANRYISWQPVNPTGTPPAPRLGHTSVYDSGNSRMIVFGGGLGRSSPCENDVWVLNHASGAGGTPAWNQSVTAGPQPAPRLWHSAVYDPTSNRMTIFGGADCFSTNFNDVWVLSNANGLGGAPTWSQLSPAGTAPSPRGFSTAVYDPANNIMIVFGGGVSSNVLNDLWLLSNANGLGGTPAWTQLTPSGPPSARSGHSAVYDAANNRMTIFGGGTATGFLSDVWVLANASAVGGTPTWTQLHPSGALPPAPRDGHTAVYDPATNEMIIFGGVPDLQSIPISDVSVLQHANGL